MGASATTGAAAFVGFLVTMGARNCAAACQHRHDSASAASPESTQQTQDRDVASSATCKGEVWNPKLDASATEEERSLEPDVVTFKVQGEAFEVLTSTIRMQPDTLLCTQLDTEDLSEPIFVEGDKALFPHILSWYRHASSMRIHIPFTVSKAAMEQECRTFGLPDGVQVLRDWENATHMMPVIAEAMVEEVKELKSKAKNQQLAAHEKRRCAVIEWASLTQQEIRLEQQLEELMAQKPKVEEEIRAKSKAKIQQLAAHEKLRCASIESASLRQQEIRLQQQLKELIAQKKKVEEEIRLAGEQEIRLQQQLKELMAQKKKVKEEIRLAGELEVAHLLYELLLEGVSVSTTRFSSTWILHPNCSLRIDVAQHGITFSSPCDAIREYLHTDGTWQRMNEAVLSMRARLKLARKRLGALERARLFDAWVASIESSLKALAAHAGLEVKITTLTPGEALEVALTTWLM